MGQMGTKISELCGARCFSCYQFQFPPGSAAGLGTPEYWGGALGACWSFRDRDTGVESLEAEVLNSPVKPAQISSCDSVLKHFLLLGRHSNQLSWDKQLS